jgi:hypothetical protein
MKKGQTVKYTKQAQDQLKGCTDRKLHVINEVVKRNNCNDYITFEDGDSCDAGWLELVGNRCYIIGKITGLDQSVYEQNFKTASLVVEELDYHAVNPVELEHDHDKTWESYMKAGIIEMMKCQAVYVQSNWKESKGATIEVELALSLGMKVIYAL